MKPHNLFISYSHKDTELMNLFKTQFLEFKGNSIEFDTWDDSELTTGYSWRKEIFDKITQCDIGIFLISPNFIESRFCTSKELIKFYIEVINGRSILIPVIINTIDNKAIYKELLSEIQAFKPEYSKFGLETPNKEEVYCHSIIPFSELRELNEQRWYALYFHELNKAIFQSIERRDEYKESSSYTNIKYGTLMAAIPNKMVFEENNYCHIHIAYDESQMLIKDGAKDGEYHYLQIRNSMNVEIDDDPDMAAIIEAKSKSLDQQVRLDLSPGWTFSVKPITRKDFKIICRASAILKDEDDINQYSQVKFFDEKVHVIETNEDNSEGINHQSKDTMVRVLNFVQIPKVATEDDDNKKDDKRKRNISFKKIMYSIPILFILGSILYLIFQPTVKKIVIDAKNPDPTTIFRNISIDLLPDVKLNDTFFIAIQDNGNEIAKTSFEEFTTSFQYEIEKKVDIQLTSSNYDTIKQTFYLQDTTLKIPLNFKYINALKGKIVDKYHNPINNAIVTLENNNIRGTTNTLGLFDIDVLNTYGKRLNVNLRARANGYKKIEKSISKNDSKELIYISLTRSDRDNDGIDDINDLCPDCFGLIENFGCNNIVYKSSPNQSISFIHINTKEGKKLYNRDSLFKIDCAQIEYFSNTNYLKVNDYKIKLFNNYCNVEFELLNRKYIIDQTGKIFISKNKLILIGSIDNQTCIQLR